jgi:hypothetical protein
MPKMQDGRERETRRNFMPATQRFGLAAKKSALPSSRRKRRSDEFELNSKPWLSPEMRKCLAVSTWSS